MERWNSRNAFPGLIKDLIEVIIVMRFRRGMAEEKGDKKQRERKRRMRRSGTILDGSIWQVGCYDKCYADLQSRNIIVIILVDVSSVRRVRNFEKYLHRFYRGNYFSCDNVNGECLEN